DQDLLFVGRHRKLFDVERTSRALRRQFLGGDFHSALTGGSIVTNDVERVFLCRRRFEREIASAVFLPTHRAQRLRAISEKRINRQQRRILLCEYRNKRQ